MLISTHKQPGFVVQGHRFEIPLDHANPDGSKISIFARELVKTQ